MKNEDLLKIAKGVGLDVGIVKANNCEYVSIKIRQGCSRKFDPENNKAQVFEVLEWLKDHGKFALISNDYVIYSPNIGGDIHVDSSDFIMNILNVSRQAVNDE